MRGPDRDIGTDKGQQLKRKGLREGAAIMRAQRWIWAGTGVAGLLVVLFVTSAFLAKPHVAAAAPADAGTVKHPAAAAATPTATAKPVGRFQAILVQDAVVLVDTRNGDSWVGQVRPHGQTQRIQWHTRNPPPTGVAP